MHWLCAIITSCTLLLIICHGGGAVTMDTTYKPIITDEVRLHQDLFYVKRLTHPTTHKLDVMFSLTLISIIDFDASSEAIIIKAYLEQTWRNPKLSWVPSKYGGIEKVNVDSTDVWVPDIYVYGNTHAQLKYNGLLDTLKTKIILSSNGTHAWLAPIILRIGCGMNVGDFPFDSQICDLRFGSSTYDGSKLNLIPEQADLKRYSESSEWILKSVKHAKDAVLYPGSNVEFSDVKYTIVLQRKPLYFVMSVVMPTTILAFLSFLVFAQPITTGERCVYVITILIALSWYVTSAIHYLPSSSDGIPLSQLFVGMSLSAMVLTLFSLCYSIGTHYGNLTNKEIPLIVRKFMLGIAAPYFKQETKRNYPLWRKHLGMIKKAENEKRVRGVPAEEMKIEIPIAKVESSQESLKATLESILGRDCIMEISKRVDIILDKMEIEDDENWKKREWNILAVVIDKILIYFFSLLFTVELAYCGFHVLHIYNGDFEHT